MLGFPFNGSTTIRLRTFLLQTFRLLLYSSIQDSYTSNFCFSKSLFSSISTSTYTMIPFINLASTDTMIIQHITVSKRCGMAIQLVLSVKEACFHQSQLQLVRIPCISLIQVLLISYSFHHSSFYFSKESHSRRNICRV